MNGILGMAGLLSETELSSEQRSYVDAVEHSARTLLTIIDEILDLSKIEAGKLEIHPAPFFLDHCLQSVIELMSPRARARGIDLAWRIEPDMPRSVIGDETRVRQILLNLVGNAIKFTDQGGVAVRVRRGPLTGTSAPHLEGSDATERVCIEVEVSDTGGGIAADQIKKLFGEFEQADDAIRRKRSGTGLGLAISRRLARAMEGDIEVESTFGSGSVFRARMVMGARPAARAVLEAPSIRRPCRVLLMSRRVQQRTLMQETLSSLNIPSETATPDTASATIAMARASGSPFNTIIADAEDGPITVGNLIATARLADGRAPRTILVVDHSGRSWLNAFKSAGGDAYLVRPVRPMSLLTQLDLEVVPAGAARLENVAPEALASAGPLPPISRGRRVLLVEDNAINALLAGRMSEKAGCVVHHAPSGSAALGWCEDLVRSGESVDLVLMDIHMPEMDGFETAKRMRRLFASRGRLAPPIVALTANAFAEDRKRCLKAGLDDYLAKPFDRSELEALLEKWCAAKRAPRDGSLGGFAA
jgi:CheY-like chemotaxis protein